MQIPGSAPVIVGVHGTAAGLAAVRLGAREAVARGAELRILHAFTWPGPARGGEPPGYATARHEAVRIMDEAVNVAVRSTPGVHATGLVVDGPPTRVLVQHSRAADLLVLADEDLYTTPRAPIDSVLLQTVSHAWCPVIVARGLRPPTGPLLVAVDGSPNALRALHYAATEACRRAVPVEITHVTERSGPAAERAAREIIAAALADVPELRGARTTVLTGDPGAALVRASRHARMLIVGPRGHDGAALLGPVAQHLLRRCACPCVFVHRASADDPLPAEPIARTHASLT